MLHNRLTSSIRLFEQGFGQYKPQIIILVVLGFLTGLLEGLGVNAIIPLFSFLTKDSSLTSDRISKAIESFFSVLHLRYSVSSILIFIIVLFILKAILALIFNTIIVRITADFEKKYRDELFRDTLNASWPFLLKQKIGYLEKVLMTDITYSTNLLRYLSSIILMLTGLVMYILVALNISVLITLYTLLIGVVIFLVFKPILHKTRVISQENAAVNKEVAHHVNENMVGIKSVKALHVEREVLQKGNTFFDRLKDIRIRIGLYENIINVATQPIGIIYITVVFAFSYHTTQFNFAAFAAIIYLIQKMFSYIESMQSKLHSINQFIPFLQSSVAFKALAVSQQEHDAGKDAFTFEQSVQFKDITFGYEESKTILTHIDFSIARGEMVGLIGPSGAGKTTIVDLLLRLHEPSSGMILIDDVDVKNIKISDWRTRIGYVSQDVFLINDTIESNIKFYNSDISEDEVLQAARMANCLDFIERLPDGLQTIVGERGVALSGGQRQRIALARILARQPQILLLDEATSSLDTESEIAIQESIKKLKGTITVLIIAHRLSTVMISDRLIILDNGSIREQGTPDELIRDRSSYFFKSNKLIETY